MTRIKSPVVYLSAALFLSMPSLWDISQQRYSTLKDSRTAMLNEEARLKQRKDEVAQEIVNLHYQLERKQKHLDAITARLSAVQNSLKDIERQM